MMDILLYTHKYFYAREITEFMAAYDYQVLSYWKSEEVISIIENSEPWIVIIDYEIGDTDWNSMFNSLNKLKSEKGFHIIALCPENEMIDKGIFDKIMYKPLLLKDLYKQINIISLKEELSEDTREELDKHIISSDEKKEMSSVYKRERAYESIVSDEEEENNEKEKVLIDDERLIQLEAENLYLKAYIYYLKGNKEDSKRKCLECIEKEPEHKKALNLLKFL